MSVAVVSERRWDVDDFARIGENVTGDEREPVVFTVAFKGMPLTRGQIVALRDGLNEVLDDVPEKRIVTL